MQQHTGTIKTLQSGGFPRCKHYTSTVTSNPVLLPVRLVLTGFLLTPTAVSLAAILRCWVSPDQNCCILDLTSVISHTLGDPLPGLYFCYVLATAGGNMEHAGIAECNCASSLWDSSLVLLGNDLVSLLGKKKSIVKSSKLRAISVLQSYVI